MLRDGYALGAQMPNATWRPGTAPPRSDTIATTGTGCSGPMPSGGCALFVITGYGWPAYATPMPIESTVSYVPRRAKLMK